MKYIFFAVALFFACHQAFAFNENTFRVNYFSSNFPGDKYNASIEKGVSAVAPSLGSAASFAMFTTTGAVGNTGVSIITGNIGTNNGAITGFGTSVVVGNFYNNNAITAQCAADLTSAYNQLTATTATAAHGAIFGNGETLYAGVYSVGAAASGAGVLKLDAQGDPNAVFIFKIGGAFNTGASTSVLLTNGASAANIFWVVEGAVAMAASTSMKGTLISNNGAISMGAGGTLEGRMFSTTGAVAVYGDKIYLPGSNGISWIGGVSTDWNTNLNWQGNVVPTINDLAFIGVSQHFNFIPTIPAGYGNVSVMAVMLGSMGGKGAGIIVNAGSTLNVTNAISYQSDGGSTIGYIGCLSGQGIINVGALNVLANTTAAVSYSQVFNSSVANLNVAGNVTLSSTAAGSTTSNSNFNLTGGTILINGIVKTINTAGSTSALSVIPAVTASLLVTDNAFLSGLSSVGTNVISFKNLGATVAYAGASQTVYNNAGITGLSGGLNYQNITFVGTGLKTLASGNLNIAGNFINALANDVANNVDLSTNIVNFNGATQTLAGGPGSGTILTNVTFDGAGTKSIISGQFYITGSGVLTMIGTNPLTVLNAGGLLTLTSTASASASVATILPGPSIIGDVKVQRYFKAQASGTTADNTRNYRLLSSPVNDGTGISALSYLNNNTGGITGVFVSGPTGNAGGFTVTNATPTIYLYNESLAASATSFSGGNFKGLTNISGTNLTYYNSSGTTTGTTTLPVGNGFFLYYVGNNVDNVTSGTALNKQYRYGGYYIAPDASTTTVIGILNQGPTTVKLWWNGSTTLSNAKTGYNLVGNPYSSSIDWDQYSASSSAAGIYAPQVAATIYVFNYSNKNYGTYIAGISGGIGTNNASRFIASGQGFFVQATAATGASLTFNEAAKTIVQPNSFGLGLLLMGLPKQIANTQLLRIKLSKDVVNTDEIILFFEPGSKNEYEPYHDANRLSGLANVTTLASMGAKSNILLSINRLHSIDTASHVKLYVNVRASAGIDTLSASGFESLDPRFDVYLIDHYKKDSLMLNRYPKYLFNINNADTASYGANRFEIVFHKKSSLNYKLLSFNALLAKTGILLTWITENENSFTGFTLERQDGSEKFVVLNSTQSNGNGTYTYTDTAPLNGTNVYRLKQNDAFDNTSYSANVSVIVPAENLAQEILTLYPNPVTDQFYVIINYNIPAKIKLLVINSAGQVMINRAADAANIHQTVSLLQPGSYIVQVIDMDTGKAIGTKKFIKK